MENKVLILYSGGADSTLLIHLAKSLKKDIFCLLISYKQLHIEELNVAEKYCKKNNIEFLKVELNNYNVKSGLTTGEKGTYEGVHEQNVPARNTIFLSIAAGIAESNGIQNIWFGADMDDYYHKFPDCVQNFIGNINELFNIAFSRPIFVEAPLLGFSKENVLLMLDYFKVKKDEIYSGYGEFE